MSIYASIPAFKIEGKRDGKTAIFVNMQKFLAMGLCSNNLTALRNIFNLGDKGEQDDLALIMKSIQFTQPVFVDGFLQLAQTGDVKGFSFAVFEREETNPVANMVFLKDRFLQKRNLPSDAWEIVQYYSVNVSDNNDKFLYSLNISVEMFFEPQVGQNPGVLVLDPNALQNSILLTT